MLSSLNHQPVKERLSLEQDPRTGTYVRNIIRRSTQKLMLSRFSNIDAEIVNESALVEGASGAVTVLVDSQVRLMFKFDFERAEKEIEGFSVMERVLPAHTLPLIAYDASAGWLCTPYLSATCNLHRIIEKSLLSETDILKVYDDFLRQMLGLWVRTYSKPASNSNLLLERLQHKTKETTGLPIPFLTKYPVSFSQLAQMPLRVNGVCFPSLMELAQLATNLINANPAPGSVTAHQDEHAKNILVKIQETHPNLHWFLIDLPNVCTTADWVWSIAQMRQWWQVSFYIDQLSSGCTQAVPLHFEISGGEIAMEYDLTSQIPDICQILDQKVANLAEQTGKLFKDETWLQRYTASMFLVFYGLIPHYWDNKQVIPILFGESAKALHSMLISS